MGMGKSGGNRYQQGNGDLLTLSSGQTRNFITELSPIENFRGVEAASNLCFEDMGFVLPRAPGGISTPSGNSGGGQAQPPIPSGLLTVR